jgi:hypothetical protein
MILIDSNVIPGIWDPDPVWHAWSLNRLRQLSLLHELAINPIIYAEISVSFSTPEALDEKLADMEVSVLNIPRQASFLAGKAYVHYRRKGGTKSSVLADFFIGAHAFVLGCPLLIRDTRRYAAYFPGLRLIAP